MGGSGPVGSEVTAAWTMPLLSLSRFVLPTNIEAGMSREVTRKPIPTGSKSVRNVLSKKSQTVLLIRLNLLLSRDIHLQLVNSG